MGFHVEVDTCREVRFRGYQALVSEREHVGSVLIVHEWFGLNDSMRAHVDRLAALGFHALAVDLYRGKVASDAEAARCLAAELTAQHAMQVIAAAAEHARRQPNATGKVALVGFCLGGAIAMTAASNVADLACAVTFCGLPPPRYTEAARVRTPIMGHYALRDPLLPIAQPQAVFEALSAAGKRAVFHSYQAGHAFMRSNSQSYHSAWAELAWQRTVGLLREELQ